MGTVLAVLGLLVAVLVVIVAPIVAFERHDAKQAAIENDRQIRSAKETSDFFIKWSNHEKARKREEAERLEARIQELSKLPWGELRAWCERIYEQPCECPTKRDIGRGIDRHEQAQEKKAKPEAKQPERLAS